MARNPNKAIWQIAIPLSEAWHKFACPDAISELENMPTWSDILLQSMPKMNSQSPTPEKISEFFSSMSQSAAGASQHIDKIKELREHLLDELFNKQLIALGYRETPSSSPAPVHIDAEIFDTPDIEWKRDTLTAHGKRYGRVRVYDPRYIPKIEKPVIGRPSSGQKINAAIIKLKNDDPYFCNLPRKEACEQIIKALGRNRIKGDGLSDQNLEKYILRHCHKRKI